MSEKAKMSPEDFVADIPPVGSLLESAKLRQLLGDKDAEIARLRKVADAAWELLPVARSHIKYPCFEIEEVWRALAELGGGEA